ncbi:hypothetical protein JW859_13140 [bacterium]|nr:hypothetical protein [bacterium]
MRGFLITFLIVIIVAGAIAYWLWSNADRLPDGTVLQKAGQALQTEPPEPPLQTPLDYHQLEAVGGIPLAEAERAGLRGADYAYLRSFEPLQISDGVEAVEGRVVRGKHYDLGYQCLTDPPEEQYLEFNIGGDWDLLHFGIGFDDAHASDPEDKWAIEIEVKGDGKLLFGPYTIKPTEPPYFTQVDVTDVGRIVFVSRRLGRVNPFTPLILDPFLRREAPPTGAE